MATVFASIIAVGCVVVGIQAVGRGRPEAYPLFIFGMVGALAVRGDRVLAVGPDARIRRLAGDHTRLIDLRGRRVIPGLTDSHTHLIRQGLSYTQELSLAGVRSVAEALRLIRHQAEHTPPPQWVRVVGGFTRHQFADGRLPTLAELNAAAPDRPVFLLHLYDRALLNRTALRILGFTKSTPAPPGSEIEHDAAGNPTGLLIARPSATLLYSTLARLPGLSPADQSVSTRHYLRHLNARGVTGVMDAGGGHQTFPDDYDVVGRLHRAGQLTARIGYHVFTQRPGDELADFRRMADLVSPGDGDGMLRMLGAGEMLAYSAADFEDFYDGGEPAIFQTGTLYLDQRSCKLCLPVDDAGKHATMAGLAGAYLAFVAVRGSRQAPRPAEPGP